MPSFNDMDDATKARLAESVVASLGGGGMRRAPADTNRIRSYLSQNDAYANEQAQRAGISQAPAGANSGDDDGRYAVQRQSQAMQTLSRSMGDEPPQTTPRGAQNSKSVARTARPTPVPTARRDAMPDDNGNERTDKAGQPRGSVTADMKSRSQEPARGSVPDGGAEAGMSTGAKIATGAAGAAAAYGAYRALRGRNSPNVENAAAQDTMQALPAPREQLEAPREQLGPPQRALPSPAGTAEANPYENMTAGQRGAARNLDNGKLPSWAEAVDTSMAEPEAPQAPRQLEGPPQRQALEFKPRPRNAPPSTQGAAVPQEGMATLDDVLSILKGHNAPSNEGLVRTLGRVRR